MSQRFPEQVIDELTAEIVAAIDSDVEFKVTSSTFDQVDSEPGVLADEDDRQLVMITCRPLTDGKFSVDALGLVRLIALPVIQFFHEDGESFLRVIGLYEGFPTIVDYFSTSKSN